MIAVSSSTFSSSLETRSFTTLFASLLNVMCGHAGTEPAARGEIARNGEAHGIAGFHDIAREAVDRILLKDAQIAVGERVHLKRFQLQTKLVGDVVHRDRAEIGQAGFGTDRSKLRDVDLDFIAGKLVRPGFDFRQFCVDPRRRVLIGVLSFIGLHFVSVNSRDSGSRNRPTSVTTPTACPVPRSLTLVATAGLISTHTILTQLGSMLPVAMECSIEPRQITSPAGFSSAAYASCAAFISVMVSGRGPSSRRLPASTKGILLRTHSNITPDFRRPLSTAPAMPFSRYMALMARM